MNRGHWPPLDKIMSKFGKNLNWFLGEVSTSLEDLQEQDGSLPDFVDVYGEDEQGRECC